MDVITNGLEVALDEHNWSKKLISISEPRSNQRRLSNGAPYFIYMDM
jgi:hypothetical protein